MVEDGAFSHKIDYVALFWEILNFEGHQNCTTGSIVMAILLNGLILPIGGASAVEGLLSTGPSPSSLLSVNNYRFDKSSTFYKTSNCVYGHSNYMLVRYIKGKYINLFTELAMIVFGGGFVKD